MEESEKRKYVQVLLDKLDKSSREERLQAARQVVFIALGTNAWMLVSLRGCWVLV